MVDKAYEALVFSRFDARVSAKGGVRLVICVLTNESGQPGESTFRNLEYGNGLQKRALRLEGGLKQYVVLQVRARQCSATC